MILPYIPASNSANALPASIEPNWEYKPPFKPHALCLTVFLSPSSFVRTKNTVDGRVEINDVKIDVYFNGALCDSRYVPRRYSGEAFTMTEHIVRFGGRRISRLIEKPWVIVPSGQNPDGGLREYRRGKVAYAGAQQRWDDVSDALLAEADKFARDGRGERPVIGEYLESLAELSMPREVEDMQKAGGPKFGVVDVVVMWGKGSKNGPDAPYIVEPTPMRIEGSTTSVNMVQTMNHPSAQDVTTSALRNAYTVPQSRSEALATAKAIDDYSKTSALSITHSPAPTATNNKTTPAAFVPPPPDKTSIPALLFDTPIRRPRGHYYDVLTTKKTLCEEIDSIATTAATTLDPKTAGYNDPATKTRTTRAKCYASSWTTAANDNNNISSPPLNNNNSSAAPMMTRDHDTPHARTTKIVTLKLPSSSSSPVNGSSSATTTTTTTTTRPTRPTPGNTMMNHDVRGRGVHGGKVTDPRGLRTPSLVEEERNNPAPPPGLKRRNTTRRERAQQQSAAAADGAGDAGGGRLVVVDRGEFVVPGLSVDCGATYASGGLVRNVGAARAGVFREGGVVMGARFVVGWG